MSLALWLVLFGRNTSRSWCNEMQLHFQGSLQLLHNGYLSWNSRTSKSIQSRKRSWKDSTESECQKKGTKSGEHLIKKHGEQYVQLYQSQCNLWTKENHVYKHWAGVFLTIFFLHAQDNSPTSKKCRRDISNNDPFEGIAYQTDFDWMICLTIRCVHGLYFNFILI